MAPFYKMLISSKGWFLLGKFLHSEMWSSDWGFLFLYELYLENYHCLYVLFSLSLDDSICLIDYLLFSFLDHLLYEGLHLGNKNADWRRPDWLMNDYMASWWKFWLLFCESYLCVLNKKIVFHQNQFMQT